MGCGASAESSHQEATANTSGPCKCSAGGGCKLREESSRSTAYGVPSSHGFPTLDKSPRGHRSGSVCSHCGLECVVLPTAEEQRLHDEIDRRSCVSTAATTAEPSTFSTSVKQTLLVAKARVIDGIDGEVDTVSPIDSPDERSNRTPRTPQRAGLCDRPYGDLKPREVLRIFQWLDVNLQAVGYSRDRSVRDGPLFEDIPERYLPADHLASSLNTLHLSTRSPGLPPGLDTLDRRGSDPQTPITPSGSTAFAASPHFERRNSSCAPFERSTDFVPFRDDSPRKQPPPLPGYVV